MLVLYHGTSREFADAMAGNADDGAIDVRLGRGEFGRGFYTQSSISNALRRGQLIYGDTGAVLVLTINDEEYNRLDFKRLSHKDAQVLNAKLRGNNTQDTYTTTHDVIVGPLVNQLRIMQQKFQSANAQALLNGLLAERSVQP